MLLLHLIRLPKRKNRMKFKYLTPFILIAIHGCDYVDDRLVLINNTSQNISFETYLDSLPDTSSTLYPDYYLSNYIMPSKQIKHDLIGSKNAWPFMIRRSKNKKLNLIVFPLDSIIKYRRMDSLIFNRAFWSYHFSEQEMEAKNWTIEIK